MALRKIEIGNYIISEKSEPYFIAEIGINHNGDMQIAKKLIDATNATNWNCVKFQKRVPEIAVPEYQKNTTKETPWGTMTYLDYKKHIEFEKAEYDEIDMYCKAKPLDWTASPWDIPSVEFLAQYDLPFIKIASASINNHDLIKACCDLDKPLIVSTGMSTIEEIDETVNTLEQFSKGNYVIMHTNSVYPANNKDLNLRMIETLRNRYNCLVGYSGHEANLQPTVVAASLGAVVIERHITLSHDMWGTDQKASLEINGMYLLRNRVISVIETMGDGIKRLGSEEMQVRRKLRA